MEFTIREAADRLGVSADTVRRRLKVGELEGRQEPQGKSGYRWIVQLPDDAQDTPTAAATTAPGMRSAEAYELADARARIEGLERLIDEIASQRDKLERERDDWKDAAQREGEASRELRHLLKQSQDLALPAQASPQARTEPLEVTHGPQRPADAPHATESVVSAWERLRRLLAGR